MRLVNRKGKVTMTVRRIEEKVKELETPETKQGSWTLCLGVKSGLGCVHARE